MSEMLQCTFQASGSIRVQNEYSVRSTMQCNEYIVNATTPKCNGKYTRTKTQGYAHQRPAQMTRSHCTTAQYRARSYANPAEMHHDGGGTVARLAVRLSLPEPVWRREGDQSIGRRGPQV